MLLFAAGVAAQSLPRLAASTGDVTVSGISSGGYMAVQFQVAYSSVVRGAGIVAGGPYYCAEGSVRRALGNCMAPSGKDLPPTPDETLRTARQLAAAGRIDPLKYLQDDRVWLLAGGNDKTVLPPVMEALDAFYRATLPGEAISFVKVPDAGHAMLSVADPQANACPTSETPFINRCQNIDAAGKLLTHLLGPLQPPAPPPAGEMIVFDQRPFVPAGRSTPASPTRATPSSRPAAATVAARFMSRSTAVCRTPAKSAAASSTAPATTAGRPATASSSSTRRQCAVTAWPGLRSDGCLTRKAAGTGRDTGENYHTRDGAQTRTVRAMIETLGMPPNL